MSENERRSPHAALALALVLGACGSRETVVATGADAPEAPPGGAPSAVGNAPVMTTRSNTVALAPAKASVTAGAPDRLLLSGTVVTPSGPIAAQVLVVGNRIVCAAPSCSGSPDASGATAIVTGGFIFPGLIDAHNHGLFNIFDETDWTPPKLYKNHNLWTTDARYKEVVDAKQFLEGTGGVRCELDKYAETKALIAGTTSMLVAPGAQQPACFASLVRTIDTTRNDLGFDKVQSAISVPDEATAKGVCENIDEGKLEAYMVHTGEGVDETSRKEFDTLTKRSGGCLKSKRVTIVHGTAFGAPEFKAMHDTEMRLVWSPKSNVFLYGDTAKIDVAIAQGVKVIAIAPDWALGGSVNMLDELRFADKIDAEKFGNILTPKRIFEMGTLDAAKALGIETEVGSIEVGKRADLFVVPGSGDAYQALLSTTPKSVSLVLVDGRILYGDKSLQSAVATMPACEPLAVCGADKFLCVAETSSADKLNQTYADYRKALEDALAAYDTSKKPPGGPLSPLAPLTKCGAEEAAIKGNIDPDGRKLYHLPGCPSYAQVKIEPEKGEKMFATEAEAQAAGWVKTPNCP